jgi:hypothetical protein
MAGQLSRPLELLYRLLGLLVYSLVGLWRRPGDSQLGATVTLTRGLFTPSALVLKVTLANQSFGTNGHHKVTSQDRRFRGELRVVGQEEVYEEVQAAVRRQAGGARAYFRCRPLHCSPLHVARCRAERIGYNTVAIDPDAVVSGQSW